MSARAQHWCRVCVCAYAVLLTACASTGDGSAPISERPVSKPQASKTDQASKTEKTAKTPIAPLAAKDKKAAEDERDWRPQVYIVQRGDTLYSIAFNYGLDYHELAELNKIQDPNVIQVGQELRLFQPKTAPVAQVEVKPLVDIPLQEQPKAYKLPYSEQALAEMQKLQETPRKAERLIAKPEPKSAPRPAENAAETEEALDWGMPTQGKVLNGFSESANRKGIDVAGKHGQAIVASAAGKVVYSGSGLRGYGKLVIIKHNKTYLSAYAHNDQILVKEGQMVSKGQKIAEMGSTDADQVKLHFEIRKYGKPVDPTQYLPQI